MKKNFLSALIGLCLFSILLISCSKESVIEQKPISVFNKMSYLNTTNDSKKDTGIIVVNYMDSFRVSIPDTNTWHYVAVVFYADNRAQIYIDGVNKVNSHRDNVPYCYKKLFLGSSLYRSFNNFYKGYIDELRISNITRSNSEIKSYYDKCVSGDYSQTLDKNSIGLWRFDESGGNSFNNDVLQTNKGLLNGNYSFEKGLSGNSIYFDGVSGMGNCNIDIPEYEITIEFWYKSSKSQGAIIQPYGLYSTDITFYSK
jgi:hypothetical protein